MTRRLISTTLPALPKTDDQAVRRWMQATSSIIEELSRKLVISDQGSVAAASTRAAADNLDGSNTETILSLTAYLPTQALDTNTPDALSSLAVTPLIEGVIIQWTHNPSGTAPDHFNIYRSPHNNSGGPTELIGTTQAKVFYDAIGVTEGWTYTGIMYVANKYIYGVEAVSTGGTIGPKATTAGLAPNGVELLPNPGRELTNRSGQIIQSDLAQSLLNSFPTITGLPSATATLSGQITNEAVARAAEITRIDGDVLVNNNLITSETIDRINSDNSEAGLRLAGDVFEAGERSIIASNLTTDINAVDASVVNETAARTSENSSIVSSQSVMSVSIDSNHTQLTGDINNAQINLSASLDAAIIDEQTVRAEQDNLLASSNSGVYVTANDAAAAVIAEQAARITDVQASASSANSLIAQAEGNTALVKEEMLTNVSRIDGTMSSSYTLKTAVAGTDANGNPIRKVAGFGIQNSSTDQSQFIINAENFSVMNNANNSVIPFSVDATTNTTFIDNALIRNLNATNISAGAITADEINAGAVTAAKLDLGNINVTGTGNFTTIQSSNYSTTAGTGWQLSADGNATFRNVLADTVVQNSNISNSVFATGSITGTSLQATDIFIKTAVTTSNAALQPIVTLFDNDGYTRGASVSRSTIRSISSSGVHDDGVTNKYLNVNAYDGAQGIAQSPHLSMVSFDVPPTTAAAYTGISNDKRQRFRTQTVNVTDEIRAIIVTLNSDLGHLIYFKSQIYQIDSGTETLLAESGTIYPGYIRFFSDPGTVHFDTTPYSPWKSWVRTSNGAVANIAAYGSQWGDKEVLGNDPGPWNTGNAIVYDPANAFFKIVATWTGLSFSGNGKIFTRFSIGGIYSANSDRNNYNRITYQNTIISGA